MFDGFTMSLMPVGMVLLGGWLIAHLRFSKLHAFRLELQPHLSKLNA